MTDTRDSVTAFAPASVSNVACGFDIMGFALDSPGDSVTLRFSDSPGIRITKVTGTTASLPLDPAENTAGAPVVALAKHLGALQGIEIEIHKGLAIGSGLGSSAASAVAAAMACNALLKGGLSKKELLPFAIEGEKIASQAVHVDNLAPSLFGGFILVRGYEPIDIVHVKAPENLWCTTIHPDIEIKTSESRKLIPATIPIRDVITQTGNAAGLVAGLLTGNFGLISRSLRDVIAEPARAHTIPGFYEMQKAAVQAGALGCSISGSGPTLFALSEGEPTANAVGVALGKVLDDTEYAYDLNVSSINCSGAKIITHHYHTHS